MDVVTELERLNELHRSGALTADEFTAAKAAILASRPAAGADTGADAGDAKPDREWTPTRGLPAADTTPYQRPAAQRPTYAARTIVGLICMVFGLYRIVAALVGASVAQSFLDEMPSMSSPGFPGTFGEVTITDSNGRPINVSPATSFDQPIRGQMKSAIGMSAGVGVLFGLAFLVGGAWLVLGGRRRVIAVDASERSAERRGADGASRYGDG